MLDPVSFQVSDASGHCADLALTEFKLLHFLMKHAGNIHTRGQILSLVWGENSGVEERTVDVYVRRLRKKLEGFGHRQLIRTVRDEGYCFVGTEGQPAAPTALRGAPRQSGQSVPAPVLAASQTVNDPLLN
jgi:DNA-binding response OmpR family regulator